MKINKKGLKKAYDYLVDKKMLRRVITTYLAFNIEKEITFKEFCAVIECNYDWLSKINLFLDMDNCLCHFSNGKRSDIDVLRKAVAPGFFINLAKMDEDINIYEILAIIGVNVWILSTCMPTPHCKEEKKVWLQNNMPWIPKNRMIFCNHGQSKSEVVMKKLNIADLSFCILVDDYKGNLLAWMNNGGFAIKKGISYKPYRPYPTILNHRDGIDFVLGAGQYIIQKQDGGK